MGTNNSKENSVKDLIETSIYNQLKIPQEKHANQILNLITLCKSKCQKPQKTGPEIASDADFDSRPIQESSLVQETVLKEIIQEQDGRTRVNATQEWPHSVHGLLSMRFGDKLYTGTATMIGPNIAITAAHNLYNFETKIEVKVSDVHFYPGANDQLLPFGVVKVLAFYYPEEYKATGKEDYALLILQQDIGYQTGYFGLFAMERQELESKKINITGYPADKVADNPKHHQMWRMGGPICHLDDNLISYKIDTYAGQDGSGIWYDAGDEYYVVGVHAHGSDAYSQGTFLDKKRLERMREWVRSFYLKPEYLQSLDLSNKGIDDKGAEYLGQLNFRNLRSLNLLENKIGDKGIEHLSKGNLLLLTSLDLSLNEIGKKGAEFLSKANFPQLQSLSLTWNQIGDTAAEYLSKANFPQLQVLNLWKNNIGDKGVGYLSKANFLVLQSLDLSSNNIGKKGAEFLSKANFSNLQSLSLRNNGIGNTGAGHLSKANFPQLQSLDLLDTQIGAKGAEYLSKSNFPNLYSLELSFNQIGDNGVEFLQIMKSNHPNAVHLKISYDRKQ